MAYMLKMSRLYRKQFSKVKGKVSKEAVDICEENKQSNCEIENNDSRISMGDILMKDTEQDIMTNDKRPSSNGDMTGLALGQLEVNQLVSKQDGGILPKKVTKVLSRFRQRFSSSDEQRLDKRKMEKGSSGEKGKSDMNPNKEENKANKVEKKASKEQVQKQKLQRKDPLIEEKQQEIDRKIKEKEQKKQARIDRRIKKEENELAKIERKVKEREEKKQARIDRKEKEEEEKQAKIDRKEKEEAEKQAKIDRKNRKKEDKQAKIDRKERKGEDKQATIDRKERKGEEKQAKIDRKNRKKEETKKTKIDRKKEKITKRAPASRVYKEKINLDSDKDSDKDNGEVEKFKPMFRLCPHCYGCKNKDLLPRNPDDPTSLPNKGHFINVYSIPC